MMNEKFHRHLHRNNFERIIERVKNEGLRCVRSENYDRHTYQIQ